MYLTDLEQPEWICYKWSDQPSSIKWSWSKFMPTCKIEDVVKHLLILASRISFLLPRLYSSLLMVVNSLIASIWAAFNLYIMLTKLMYLEAFNHIHWNHFPAFNFRECFLIYFILSLFAFVYSDLSGIILTGGTYVSAHLAEKYTNVRFYPAIGMIRFVLISIQLCLRNSFLILEYLCWIRFEYDVLCAYYFI